MRIRAAITLNAAAVLALTPAVAVAGWYLLEPPLVMKKDMKEDDPAAFNYVTDTPFSKWYRQGVFDSAKECTAEKQRRIDEARRHLELTSKGKRGAWWSYSRVSFNSAEASECVASDDPRLLR